MAIDQPIEFPGEYREYFRLFNERRFFDAHEVLEDLWVIEVEPLRTYYKGLIMMAVAILHWQRGNESGARKLYLLANDNLKGYPAVYEGFALGDFLKTMNRLFVPLVGGSENAKAPVNEELPELGLFSSC